MLPPLLILKVMAVYREAPTCLKCGKQIKPINKPNDGSFIGDDFIKWDYEGHKCSDSRVRLLKMAEDLGITGLVKALKDPVTNSICEDIRNFGWILCSTTLPTEEDEYLVTDGKEIGIGEYIYKGDKRLEAIRKGFIETEKEGWRTNKQSIFNNNIVAWTYKPDLMELQDYIKNVQSK